MSLTISIADASPRLAELVHSLGPADEIVLTDGGRPVARLVGGDGTGRPPRVPGLLRGQLTIVAEDDEHLADFEDAQP